MKIHRPKKLSLQKETVRRLTNRDLRAGVFGGKTVNSNCEGCDSEFPNCTNLCDPTVTLLTNCC